MYGKTELDRLRFRIVRLYDSLYSVSSSFDVSLQDAASALNAGVAANAGALINVSNSLSVSLEQAKSALQLGLEANASALLNVSSSLSVSLDQAKNALQAGLEANAGALITASSSLSTSLKTTKEALELALGANISAVIQLSQSTSASLSSSAAALREGLKAVGGTILDVSSSLSTSMEESGRLLRISLTNLVNQNSESFKSRVDGLDGKVDGVLDDVVILSGSYGDYTSSVNAFTGTTKTNIDEFSRKTKAFSENENDESAYKASIYSGLSDFSLLKAFNYNSFFAGTRNYPTPPNYWAYTVSYPTGTNPFKINSYSYMGSTAGKKYWNLEEVIAYSKREYSIDESSAGGYNENETMIKTNGEATIIKDSILSLKADQIQIEKGRTNITSPTTVIIGETSETDGLGLDQGQLFVRDEDSNSRGLQIGYRYQLDTSPLIFGNQTEEYARIQTVGGTDIRINSAGGKVNVGNTRNVAKLNVETDILVTNGDVNTYYFHYTRDSSNAGAVQVRSNASSTNINGTAEYWFYINPDGGNIKLGSTYAESVDVVPGNHGTIRLGTSGQAWGELHCTTGLNTTSDERSKYEIKNSDLGLEFIKKIEPVSYKLKSRDKKIVKDEFGNDVIQNIPGVRPHYGFIAQQIKNVLGDKDFAGYTHDKDSDLKGLRYEEFIAPIVKAIQELSSENDYLKNKLQEKDKQMQDILLRLALLESK